MLSYKYTDENKLKFSSARKGKSNKKSAIISAKPLVSKNTTIKLKLRAKGVKVFIYDKSYKLVK